MSSSHLGSSLLWPSACQELPSDLHISVALTSSDHDPSCLFMHCTVPEAGTCLNYKCSKEKSASSIFTDRIRLSYTGGCQVLFQLNVENTLNRVQEFRFSSRPETILIGVDRFRFCVQVWIIKISVKQYPAMRENCGKVQGSALGT